MMMIRTQVPGPATGLSREGPLWVLMAVLLAGASVCLYLTRFHENAMYGDRSVGLANCPESETTNCEAVNTSGYSELAGIPISALGIPTYLLLLGMVVAARRRPRLLSHVFSIGLLTFGYSVYLYYVSTVKIGFLCVWCFRLYVINAGIPVLAFAAARRNPLRLVGDALDDVRRLAPEARRSAAVFAALLVLTILADLGYRSSLTAAPTPAPSPAPAPAEAPPVPVAVAPSPPPSLAPSPTKPAAPVDRAASPSRTPRAAPPAAAPSRTEAAPTPAQSATASFVVASPLKEITGHRGGVEVRPFDLQSRLGKGRPVALLFWAPGFATSEKALVDLSRFLIEQAPQNEVFAIAGKREDQRPEVLWEKVCMLDRPPNLPLLMDDTFEFSKQLNVTDVPNLALIDGSGSLVISKIKGLEQIVALAPERSNAEQIIRRVARGSSPEPIRQVPPYYPATELIGRCAPAFTLPDVMSHRDVTFTGRSANGRPTFLVFWSATCKHCQKEIPQLIEYLRARPDAIDVVSVSFIKPDRPDGFSHRKVTEAYVRTNGISWPVLDDSSGYADDLYGVVSTPTTFLLSASGQILDVWLYPHESLTPVIDAELPRLAAANGACRPAGPQAPAHASFSVVAPDGRTVPLQSVADRPSLVHLWATWCVPCQTELPEILKFRRPLEGAGGRLVLVSVEDAAAGDRIRAYGTRLDPSFESFRAPQGGLADLLDLGYSVPRTLIVTRDGSVLKTLYGAQPWGESSFREKIRALLQLPGLGG
jgi:thiol-disulfide isomerase/thioredoxin/uncharacterized membrane protein